MGSDEAGTKQDKRDDVKVPVKNLKNVPKKVAEALMLPTCMNLNPRSIYNKVQAFATFIKEHQVSCVMLGDV